MQLIGLLLSILLLTAYYFSSDTAARQEITSAVQLDSVAASIVIYQRQAAEYAFNNPGFTGAIPAASLNLPSWYAIPPGIYNYASAGSVYVYYTDNRPGLPAALYGKSRATGVGVAKAGFLYTPQGNNTGRALPAVIANGSLVYAQ